MRILSSGVLHSLRAWASVLKEEGGHLGPTTIASGEKIAKTDSQKADLCIRALEVLREQQRLEVQLVESEDQRWQTDAREGPRDFASRYRCGCGRVSCYRRWRGLSNLIVKIDLLINLK